MQKDFVIKAKHAVKRVAAISAGATLMGATMMGAVAADLSDYPAPFVEDGQLNGVVVVGASADMADMIGAGDIIATLTQATVSTGTSSTTTVGGKSDDMALGTDVDATFDQTAYTDSDIAGLIDSEIEFNDSDYNVHESLTITGDLQIGISDGDDAEYGDSIYLETEDEGAFNYWYVFDTALAAGQRPTTAEPMKVNVLGKDLRITNWASNNTFTLRSGTEAVLNQGESVMVDGKTVTVDVIGESTVSISVGDETEFLADDDTEEIGTSGVEVEVEDILYTDDAESRTVMLFVGTDVSNEITNGDSMELFGEPDQESDAEWLWAIALDGDGFAGSSVDDAPVIGATHNQEWNDNDDDMIGEGGRITLPNDYGYMEFTGTTNVEYSKYTITFDDQFDGAGYSNAPAMKIMSDQDDEGLSVAGVDTDTVWIRAGDAATVGNITYLNSSNEEVDVAIAYDATNISKTQIDLEFGDTDWDVWLDHVGGANSTVQVRIQDSVSTEFTINVTLHIPTGELVSSEIQQNLLKQMN